MPAMMALPHMSKEEMHDLLLWVEQEARAAADLMPKDRVVSLDQLKE